MQTYRASCHCGRVAMQFRSPEITSGKRCNCSLCTRRGALMSVAYYAPDAFLSLSGLEALTRYQFGDHQVNHYFCATCGIYTFHEAADTPGHLRVNLGCVDGIDPMALPYELVDGRSF